MGTQFWFFYDIAIIIIVVICIYSGYKKGFMKTGVLILGYVASLVVSWLIGSYVAEPIYEKYFKEKNIEILSNIVQTNDYATQLSNTLKANGVEVSSDQIKDVVSVDSPSKAYEYLSAAGYYDGSEEEFNSILSQSVGGTIGDMLSNTSLPYSDSISENIFENNTENLYSVAESFLTGNTEDFVSMVEENYLKNIEIQIIKILITAILTGAMMAFLNVLITKKYKSEKLSTVNGFFGGVVGIASGLFYIYILSSIVHILVTLGKEQMMFFNDDVINNTLFFQYFYRVLLHI